MGILKKVAPWMAVAALVLCVADIVVGMRAGKSLANVAMFPSLATAAGSAAWLVFSFMNTRTVSLRVTEPKMPNDLMGELENLFSVASDPDVPPALVEALAGIAGAKIKAHRMRSTAAALSAAARITDRVIVTIPGQPGAQT